jgi:esterase
MILHTDRSGQGQPVVLIHGLFGSLENLGMIARQLQAEFDVISVDQRNHGRSPHSAEMSYPLMAEDLAQTLDQLGLSRVALLGHSMGGKTAMEFALRYPERVSHLILADISPVVSQARHLDILQALQAVDFDVCLDRKQVDAALKTGIPDAGTRAFLLRSLQKNHQTLGWRFALSEIASNYYQVLAAPVASGPFTGPTLFIKGGNSDYLLPAHQSVIQQLFPAAKAKVIAGTGHWLHAEKPAIFARICRDFLLT